LAHRAEDEVRVPSCAVQARSPAHAKYAEQSTAYLVPRTTSTNDPILPLAALLSGPRNRTKLPLPAKVRIQAPFG
jgi:hypothetical protein